MYYKSPVFLLMHIICLPFTYLNNPLIKVHVFREKISRPFAPVLWIERFMGQLVEARTFYHTIEKETKTKTKQLERLSQSLPTKSRKEKVAYIKERMKKQKQGKKQGKDLKTSPQNPVHDFVRQTPSGLNEVSFGSDTSTKKSQ